MEKNIVQSLMLIGLTFFMLTACSDDDMSPFVTASSSPCTLSLNVQGEKKVEINTRASNETMINNVWVAVVHDDQTIECRNFTTVANDKVVISDVRINEGDTLHVFANTEETSVPVNITKEELLKYFTCTQEKVNNGVIMMYGTYPEKKGDVNSQNISVNLYRVPAKVTVKSDVEGFAVTQFKVCRIPKSVYVSYADGYPDTDITSSDPVVINPDLTENPVYFIPRKDNSNLGIRENTCLLVQLDGKQGWYRLDFYLGTDPVANEGKVKFEDIIRNNWYNFTIMSVNSDGYETEEEALSNIGSNIIYKMDVSSSQGVSTNGQYSLITDKDEIVVNDFAAINISALLTPEVELSTYKVKLICPSGQLELVGSSTGEIDFLSDGATLKQSDDSKHTVQIKTTGGDLSDSYLECRLGNIVKRIPIQLATANCYKVDFNTPGTKVSVSILQANSDGTVRISGNNVVPVFIWADHPVAESDLEMTYNAAGKSIDITNKVPYSGNIIIGASVDGEIKWSWHLWCLASGQNVEEMSALGRIWMDRALGAYDLNDVNGCGGLLYQHGRKDPFIGLSWAASLGSEDEPSIYYYETPFKQTDNHPHFNESCMQTKNENNNISFAISHPYVFIRGNNIVISGDGNYDTEYDNDWVTNSLEERNKTLDLWTKNDEKTIYDPCPYGWRVPRGYTSGPFAGLLLANQELGDTYCSWPDLGKFYYAAVRMYTGDLNHFTANSKGSAILRWAEVFAHLGAANATFIGENYLAYRTRDVARAWGATIRCVKDE